MRVHIQRLGHLRVVLLLTSVAILLSLTISLGMASTLLTNIGVFETIILALLIPAIIAPFITSPLVKLLIKVHYLEEEMRLLASTDSLTGLLSRTTLINKASLQLERCVELQQPFAVLMVDLDHFKKINDRYGHHAGDEALRTFGLLANSVKREEDLAGRLGGEEFLLLLPNTTQEKAVKFSQRLHSRLRTAQVFSERGLINFTASMGVSAFTPGVSRKTSLEKLISEADQALYMAKNNGRNHTVSYTPMEEIYSVSEPMTVAV